MYGRLGDAVIILWASVQYPDWIWVYSRDNKMLLLLDELKNLVLFYKENIEKDK